MKKTPKSKVTKVVDDFDPENRGVWRDWLSKNNDKSNGVWLHVQKKNSSRSGVTLDEAIDEAVAFGWIDSKLNVVDENSYKLMITPRKKGGTWSKSNKVRVEKLQQQGLMTSAGMRKVEEAKRDGSWSRLEEVDNLKLPEDFEKALRENAKAHQNFEAFPDSAKKQLLWWIASTKTQETRSRRIQQAVALASENKRTP